MSRHHVTIRDVAARAGVSHQTVSRVINGRERVNPATRDRVEAAIEALGYQPNASARSMSLGRTGILACLAPNLTDYTFASIIDGAEQAVRQAGYLLLSASAADADAFADLIAQLVPSRQVEGLMVINPYADERFQRLPAGFPVVFAGARPREDAVSSVSLDDVGVGRMAVEHLVAQGRQRIAMVTGPLAEDCAQDRQAGYIRALHACGRPVDPHLIIAGAWQASAGYDAFMRLAQTSPLPDAVFAQNDQLAAGVLRAASDLGLQTPTQLAVIGVDDIPMAAYFSPPLTTLRQDFARIGREAAHLLLQALAQPLAPPQHKRLPAELIIRRSTG